jgi:hypothetical protein
MYMPMEEAIGQGYISPQILCLPRCSQSRGEGGRGGGKLPRDPTVIGPQLESECLKLSRFFKFVRAFLKFRAPYCSSTCSVAKVCTFRWLTWVWLKNNDVLGPPEKISPGPREFSRRPWMLRIGLQIYWWPMQDLLIGKIISTMYLCISKEYILHYPWGSKIYFLHYYRI